LILVTPWVKASVAFLELGLSVVQPPKYPLFFRLLSFDWPDLVRFLMEERERARDGEANPAVGVDTCFPAASSKGIVEERAIEYFSANGRPKISVSSYN
jgi:hypothetical protein